MRRQALFLPAWLKPSAAVDIAQVHFAIRPVLRTETRRNISASEVQRWARQRGWFAHFDDRFVAFSPFPELGRRVLALDRSAPDHTYLLGLALAYPACCSRAAARNGESVLDDLGASIGAARFIGRFSAINPSGYLAGRALISHIPCSPHCAPSLDMAETLIRALKITPAILRRGLPQFRAAFSQCRSR
jgi:hypothetical protein